MYYEYAVAEKVYNSIVDEVNLEISDDDARSVTVEHIFIKTYHEGTDGKLTDYSESAKREARERAQEIRDEAVTNRDFESLCVSYNEDSTSTHTYRRGEMPESYEEMTLPMILPIDLMSCALTVWENVQATRNAQIENTFFIAVLLLFYTFSVYDSQRY